MVQSATWLSILLDTRATASKILLTPVYGDQAINPKDLGVQGLQDVLDRFKQNGVASILRS